MVNLLADGTRREILELLERSELPLSVDDVAAAIGLHRTVAAGHLSRLAAAGLLGADEERGFRGRPRRRYRLLAAGEAAWPPRRHRELARVLATALAGLGAEGLAAARAAGLALGASLAGLDELGAGYEVGADGILRARPCVFREACAEAGRIVCQTHAAVIEGALGERYEPLGPCPGGCTYRRSVSF